MAGRSITLAQAQALVEATLKDGRARNLQPLTVAVLDPGGHLLALAREDNSSNLRPQIAIGKANGALALGLSSRALNEMAAERPTFVNSLGMISPGGIVPAAGGLLIRNADKEVVGAVGVTGDLSDNDELAAMAGIAAIGF
ncbi:GlcG/HbpS family heme-binding protein [Sphingobium sp. LSP13-1-1.1]|uniref:GlcG/HbpS family heme-binding protein n=1 Tax=Sphingobium sp. LSP13-1-1.1 TaxID=3135234 RepID=UPI003417F52B